MKWTNSLHITLKLTQNKNRIGSQNGHIMIQIILSMGITFPIYNYDHMTVQKSLTTSNYFSFPHPAL